MAGQPRLGCGAGVPRPVGRYRVRMSTRSGHPLRRLLLLVLAIGVVVVVRNATADRGGSYDPAAAESGHDGVDA